MNQELLYADTEKPKRRFDNLFVALLPPLSIAEDSRDRGLELEGRHCLRGNRRPTSHSHLTLFHVGNFFGLPIDIVEASRRACSAAAALSQAFAFELDQAACFGSGWKNTPLVLKRQERHFQMDRLHERVVIQFHRQGISHRKKSKKFEPHITLSYLNGTFPTESIDPVGWMVRDLVLIHSLVGQTKYIELGRWKLGE
ncbi:MAG: 2'-5' RNA ligase family protein [Verrucomicrobiota bacterium]